MLNVKCIQKFRDKNNIIIGYRIIDQNGNTKDIYPESLKQVIKQGKLEVINLTLTSDNRLIDKAITQISTQQSHQKTIDINIMLLKLKLLGCVTEIDEKCNHKIYLAKISEEDYRLIIPDDVTKIEFDYDHRRPTPINKIPIKSSNAKLTAYGGNNLGIAKGLFEGTNFRTIDLRKFNTSKVTNMSWMFSDCQATFIDLSNFDTSKVTDMPAMFSECRATSLDLSSFDTSNATDMNHMFSNCRATSIDLSSFDTREVTNMSGMFNHCKATSLDLSSFDTSKVRKMGYMFNECKATSLDLSRFDTSNVTEIGWMFSDCQATYIDLSSFNTSRVTYMKGIFSGCKATYINFGENKDLKSAWNNRNDWGN